MGLAPGKVGGIVAAIAGASLLIIGALCAYICCFASRGSGRIQEGIRYPEMNYPSINSPIRDSRVSGKVESP